MIRQRALAWAAILALVASVPIAPLPTRFSAPVVALAQDDSAADAGEPTDLAIVALHCAEAPAAEALTSFFTDGAAPTECAPAVGVTIAVTENGAPVAGSPFTTDVAGSLALPVGLGSAIEVREDPKSLPCWIRAPHARGQRRPLRQPGAARPGRGRSRRALRQRTRLPSPPSWPKAPLPPRRVSRPIWRSWRCNAPMRPKRRR